MTKSDYVCEYLAYKTKTSIFDFNFASSPDYNYFCDTDDENSNFKNLKDLSFSVIDEAHCFVGNEIHNKVLRYDPKLRKEFCFKTFARLIK